MAACAAGLLAGTGAHAQTVVSAQSASISAASGTIVAARVPVQVGTGAVQYFDVTMSLTGTVTNGVPTGVTVTGSSAPSVVLQASNFSAGTYTDTHSSNNSTYSLQGPSVGAGGKTGWSLENVSCNDSQCLFNASWYTDLGPNNPVYLRLKRAGINTNSFGGFGISGPSGGNFYLLGNFFGGALIGTSQTGSCLTLQSFSYINGNNVMVDVSTPQATFTICSG
jgi:hypothetical protein